LKKRIRAHTLQKCFMYLKLIQLIKWRLNFLLKNAWKTFKLFYCFNLLIFSTLPAYFSLIFCCYLWVFTAGNVKIIEKSIDLKIGFPSYLRQELSAKDVFVLCHRWRSSNRCHDCTLYNFQWNIVVEQLGVQVTTECTAVVNLISKLFALGQ
jgi:hypothetical protein